jgi:hypothetical protein
MVNSKVFDNIIMLTVIFNTFVMALIGTDLYNDNFEEFDQ